MIFVNDLKQGFLSLPEVKRLKELEGFIDTNLELNQKINELKDLQKKMVNAKEYNQPKQYLEYKKAYDIIYEDILDFPFVEEYLDLLDSTNEILKNITMQIEDKINEKLK